MVTQNGLVSLYICIFDQNNKTSRLAVSNKTFLCTFCTWNPYKEFSELNIVGKSGLISYVRSLPPMKGKGRRMNTKQGLKSSIRFNVLSQDSIGGNSILLDWLMLTWCCYNNSNYHYLLSFIVYPNLYCKFLSFCLFYFIWDSNLIAKT